MSKTTSHGLSKNDFDVIKMYTGGKEISTLAEKSLVILSTVFGGLHNLSSSQLEKFSYFDNHCVEYVMFGSMSTYDDDKLTRLVLMAHDEAVRVTIEPRSFRYITLQFYEREREGRFYNRHPSIESVIKSWRM